MNSKYPVLIMLILLNTGCLDSFKQLRDVDTTKYDNGFICWNWGRSTKEPNKSQFDEWVYDVYAKNDAPLILEKRLVIGMSINAAFCVVAQDGYLLKDTHTSVGTNYTKKQHILESGYGAYSSRMYLYEENFMLTGFSN